jgi:hypothetical protein
MGERFITSIRWGFTMPSMVRIVGATSWVEA